MSSLLALVWTLRLSPPSSRVSFRIFASQCLSLPFHSHPMLFTVLSLPGTRARRISQFCFSICTLAIRQPCSSVRTAMLLRFFMASTACMGASLSMDGFGKESRMGATMACSFAYSLCTLHCIELSPRPAATVLLCCLQLLLGKPHPRWIIILRVEPETPAPPMCSGHSEPTTAASIYDTSGVGSDQTNAAARGSPTPLCLDSLLPWTPPRAHAFGVIADMVRPFTELCHFSTLQRDFPSTAQLHKAARTLVHGVPAWPGCPLTSVVFFTDGSYRSQPPQATWAVAVFGRDSHGTWYWCGFKADRLTPKALQQWGHSPFPAEIFAMTVAQILLLTAAVPEAAIFYDATAAFSVVACDAKPAQPNHLTAAARSLTALHQARGQILYSKHTPSHQDNPGNELADSLTHLAHLHDPSQTQAELETLLCAPEVAWLWVAHTAALDLPHIDDTGYAAPQISSSYGLTANRSPQQLAYTSHNAEAANITVELHLATYNTLSMRRQMQQQVLAELFASHGRHSIGLQETRVKQDGVSRCGPFTAYASDPQDGQGGCQLWIAFGKAIGHDTTGQPLYFEASSFMVRHATPTRLLVTGNAGALRFLFVVAHAPTSQRTAVEIRQWWQKLADAIRSMPRGCIPLFMLDANAHFAGDTSTASTDQPTNANAKSLQSLAADTQTLLSATVDRNGRRLVTWISPNGDPYCLDFLAVPTQWHSHSCTHQPAEFPDLFAGIDHQPVYLDIRAQLVTKANSRERISARALRTPEGQQALQTAWQTLPPVPWAVDVDTHLRYIHDHLRHVLLEQMHVGTQPRSPIIRQNTWQLLRLQRGHRRLLRRMNQQARKMLLHVLFKAWRAADPTAQHDRAARPILRLQLRIGLVARDLGRLKCKIKRAFSADQAHFARDMMQQARQADDLHYHLRAVLKVGRRYKAPTALPTLVAPNGEPCLDRESFLQCLRLHFATAERAVAQDFSALQSEHGIPPVATMVQVAELPTLEEYAAGFSRLKTGKAPGISGIPPEVYRAAPLKAARAHYPLLLKSVSNGRSPTLWRGGASVPIAKSGKDPATVKGWRSILLLEPSQKALGVAIRPALLQALSALTHPGLAGAQRGLPLSLPSMLVSLHVSMLCHEKASGGVLFLDGESAFYNTVRAYLHPQSPECHPRSWTQHLLVSGFITEEQHEALSHKDLLTYAAVPNEIQHALRTLLQGTWYTTSPSQPQVYRSQYGTVPGTPLADILFVLTYTIFVEAYKNALRLEGLLCNLPGTQDDAQCEAPIPTWLDDSAVLLKATSAASIEADVARATTLAKTQLRILGIPVNLQPGKSEALIISHGKEARNTRHHLFVDQDATIPLPSGETITATDHYVHLGTHVTQRASPAADLARRAQLAEAAFRSVRKRLLPNGNLTCAERHNMLEGTVFQKFLFGLERWNFDTQKDWQTFRMHYMSYLRRNVRPLHGFTSKLMADQQVCAIMHFCTPDEARHIQLARALWQALASDVVYLHVQLHRETHWLAQSFAATQAIVQALQLDSLPAPPSCACHFSAWRDLYLRHFPSICGICRRYKHHCIASRETLASDVTKQWQYQQTMESKGVCLFHTLPLLTTLDAAQPHKCHACAATFRSKAAMAAHQRKTHGVIAPSALFARGTACQACSVEFWTTPRLRDHLRHQPGCLAAHSEADLPLPLPHELVKSQRLARPATKLVGPVPFWATLRPSAPPAVQEVPADPLYEALLHAIEQARTCTDRDQLFVQLGPRLHQLCRHHMEVRENLDDLLTPQALEQAAVDLCHSFCDVISAERDCVTKAGCYRQFGRWMLWIPAGTDFCVAEAGLQA